jgi:hypothetical protein
MPLTGQHTPLTVNMNFLGVDEIHESQEYSQVEAGNYKKIMMIALFALNPLKLV